MWFACLIAWLGFWTGCSPINSVPIIAFRVKLSPILPVKIGSGRLGLGTHPWLRVAAWRDRADVSVFFFRFHSGGLDWN